MKMYWLIIINYFQATLSTHSEPSITTSNQQLSNPVKTDTNKKRRIKNYIPRKIVPISLIKYQPQNEIPTHNLIEQNECKRAMFYKNTCQKKSMTLPKLLKTKVQKKKCKEGENRTALNNYIDQIDAQLYLNLIIFSINKIDYNTINMMYLIFKRNIKSNQNTFTYKLQEFKNIFLTILCDNNSSNTFTIKKEYILLMIPFVELVPFIYYFNDNIGRLNSLGYEDNSIVELFNNIIEQLSYLIKYYYEILVKLLSNDNPLSMDLLENNLKSILKRNTRNLLFDLRKSIYQLYKHIEGETIQTKCYIHYINFWFFQYNRNCRIREIIFFVCFIANPTTLKLMFKNYPFNDLNNRFFCTDGETVLPFNKNFGTVDSFYMIEDDILSFEDIISRDYFENNFLKHTSQWQIKSFRSPYVHYTNINLSNLLYNVSYSTTIATYIEAIYTRMLGQIIIRKIN